MKWTAFVAFFAFTLTAAPALAGKSVPYTVGGKAYEGYIAKASGSSKGLVLIIHDWDGVDAYEVKRADMLAAMGYDAFAVDLYGKGNRPKERDLKKAETKKLYDNRELMRTLILAGLSEARQQGATRDAVVMGYCFGGAAVLELARSGKGKPERVKGYATFHGGLKTPGGQSYPKDSPPILIAHGAADTSITMADVVGLSAELEQVGVPYQIQVYSGAPHAFTVFGTERYRETADSQSWGAFASFLKETLGR